MSSKQSAGGGRVFVLDDRDMGAFLWGNCGKLVPGETLTTVCERTVSRGQGLWLEVRVILKTPHQLEEILARFFIPGFGEKKSPWALFLTPQTLPVVFLTANATPPPDACITVRHEKQERQDLNTGRVREFDVYHTLLHIPTKCRERARNAKKRSN